MKGNYKPILKLVVSVTLLGFLFYKIDFFEALKLINKVNYLILIPILLYIPALLISTVKWRIALKNEEKFSSLFKTYWISNFFSNFLPSTIGGDSYKVIKLRKKFGTQKVLNSVILDRASGLLGLILLSSICSFFVYNITSNIYLLVIPNLLLLFAIIGLFIAKSINFKYEKLEAYRINLITNSNRIFLKLLFLSLIFISFGAISLWTYFFMFGYSINFLIILSFYCIIQIVSMIPISLNSIGLTEVSIVYFFTFIGVPAEVSLSVALLSRLIMLFQTSIGGLIYLFYQT